jgi:hypothetical protein
MNNNRTLIDHLTRQIVFSKGTFGINNRLNGLLDHISKELIEIKTEIDNCQNKSGQEKISNEFVDVVILALDGLWRSVQLEYPYLRTDDIANISASYIFDKQNKNENRVWPDWRTTDSNKAIEHVRGIHD